MPKKKSFHPPNFPLLCPHCAGGLFISSPNFLIKNTAAVVCADGLGDALILRIISHHLANIGIEVVTFSNYLKGFGSWFPNCRSEKQPQIERIEEIFKPFDLIILQHDNSLKAKKIKDSHPNVFTFYGSHIPSKHGILSPHDYVCDLKLHMVQNVVNAAVKWCGSATSDNGLTPKKGLIHRKYPKRIAIHPSSADPKRNWPLKNFEEVAAFLQNNGFEPFFLFENEKPVFPNLEDLASFLFESGAFLGNDSGPGHLASSLKIPSLIIGKDYHHLLHWRPGWLPPVVLTPPRWITHFKAARPYWNRFISTRNVTNQLINKVINTN